MSSITEEIVNPGSAPAQRVARVGPSRALRLLPLAALGLDAILIVAAVGLAAVGRARLSVFETPAVLETSLRVASPVLVSVWLAVLVAMGAYRRDVYGEGAEELRRVGRASILTAGMIGIACFLAKFPLSRGFFALAFATGIPLLFAGRVLLRRGLRRARLQGKLLHRVMLAGPVAAVDEVADVMQRERWIGYSVIGALTPTPGDTVTPRGIPILGRVNDLAQVSASKADLVCFVGGAFDSGQQLRAAVWELEGHDVQVMVAPNVTDVSDERVRMRPVAGMPLVHIGRPRSAHAARWQKRTLDIVGSSILILLFSPLLAFAALQIKLSDGGGVLFRQTRIGRDGQPFACLKFRTMVMDADSLIETLQVESGGDAMLFKLKDDWRITKPGEWLRRYSVDELPQLFNVWRGHMSLVGPRPQVAREVALYTPAMRRRLRVRPGMTGLWQVSGRSNLSLVESVRLDLFYVDNWSMLQDLAILTRTVNAVVRGKGAY